MNYPPSSTCVRGFKKISWIIGMRSESVLWVRKSQGYWTRYRLLSALFGQLYLILLWHQEPVCAFASVKVPSNSGSSCSTQAVKDSCRGEVPRSDSYWTWRFFYVCIDLSLSMLTLGLYTYIIYTVASPGCWHLWNRSTFTATFILAVTTQGESQTLDKHSLLQKCKATGITCELKSCWKHLPAVVLRLRG